MRIFKKQRIEIAQEDALRLNNIMMKQKRKAGDFNAGYLFGIGNGLQLF